MKKLIALVLCAMLALGCAAAAAEAVTGKTELINININGAFALKGLLPDGYSWQLLSSDSVQMTGIFTSEDKDKPAMQLSVAFDESWAEVERFNDLSDEDKKILEDSFRQDSTVDITYTETALGTQLMVIRETGSDRDYVDFFTIYRGHLIELVLVAGPESESTEITQEQFDQCIKLLSDLDFDPLDT